MPVPAIIFLVLLAIFWVVMSKTRFGRQIYATGGNATAAHLSGIKTKRVKLIAFMLSGLLASVAGMIHSAQISQGGPNEGMSYEMYAVAAVAIGGTSMAGGLASILGTVIGAFIVALMQEGILAMGFTISYQYVLTGLIVLGAVIADTLSRRRRT